MCIFNAELIWIYTLTFYTTLSELKTKKTACNTSANMYYVCAPSGDIELYLWSFFKRSATNYSY